MAHHTQDNANNSVRPFSLSDPQYNMNTYFGRLSHFFNVFNPM